MNKLTLILIVPLVAGCATNGGWSNNDTGRQLVYTGMVALDAATTMDIRNHAHIVEVAPVTKWVLGANPEPISTVAFFTTLALLNWAVSRSLPQGELRTGWQTLSTVVSGGFVINNWRLGLRP